MSTDNHLYKPEWEEYYKTLESIRRSKAVNMFGAAPELAEVCNIDKNLARQVLCSWMDNYDMLAEKYGWR